ncbi:hypothetical protein [Plantactinospora sp. KBS50]|uniref:hypothetical protein n=1 Tax=Plantactinospora sp. KBS50 TaxID=2024580 RepID=UPI000BAACE1D|nr:hypothetical protein [Plantactinospora sp. KBS50]ASW55153.1 hypothetical protein CIK06_14685 [Plantactinospora sp. KBS50]
MRTPDDETGREPVAAPTGRGGTALAPAPDLPRYREAVADLLAELTAAAGAGRRRPASAVVAARAGDPELRALWRGTPDGADGTAQRLLGEIAGYRPSARSSAIDLPALVRIFLLSRVDALWWGAAGQFRTDLDVRRSPELVDLEPLRRAGQLRFRYLRQAESLPARAARAARRRLAPDLLPRTAGLRFPRTRPAVLALLDRLADDFAAVSPGAPGPVWVTSLVRSRAHQDHLRELGYAALLPSAHCSGYAADIELAWHRRRGTDTALGMLLLDRQRAGEINVIDEGQAWHVCVSPSAVAASAPKMRVG